MSVGAKRRYRCSRGGGSRLGGSATCRRCGGGAGVSELVAGGRRGGYRGAASRAEVGRDFQADGAASADLRGPDKISHRRSTGVVVKDGADRRESRG